MINKDTPGLIDLDYTVNNILFSLQLDNKLYAWVLQKLINQLRDVNIFHLKGKGISSTILTISDVNTAILPEDYIDYIFVGTVINGEKVSFGHNKNIAKVLAETCAEDTNKYQSTKKELPTYQHYSITGGERIVDFTIDLKNRRIIFKGDVSSMDVLLEYISSGITYTKKTLVPVQYYSMLEAYIDYHNEMVNLKGKSNMIFIKSEKYVQELKRVREFQNKMTLEEFYDAIRQGYQQTIKR